MTDRKDLVTMKGNPVVLTGEPVKVGDKMPECKLVANDLSEKTLSSYTGKLCILSSVPSLDTPVCDMETRRFNKEAGNMGPDVVILTISMDLPFAQKRWCGASGVTRVETLSDYRYASFGKSFGVLIQGLNLLARAVFVVDRRGVIRYIQIVPEIASEPNYDEILKEIKKLI
jgi:thioredoxin-dependent peroxiredoxin